MLEVEVCYAGHQCRLRSLFTAGYNDEKMIQSRGLSISIVTVQQVLLVASVGVWVDGRLNLFRSMAICGNRQ